MDKKIFALNLVYAIIDLLFAALTVLVITWAAVHFDKLWIMAFLVFPVTLFNTHSVILEDDFRRNRLNQLKPNGKGDGNAKT